MNTVSTLTISTYSKFWLTAGQELVSVEVLVDLVVIVVAGLVGQTAVVDLVVLVVVAVAAQAVVQVVVVVIPLAM